MPHSPTPFQRSALDKAMATEWTKHGKAKLALPEQAGQKPEKISLRLANKRTPESDNDENAGDATVPRLSGKLIEAGGESVRAVFCMKGVEHGASYKDFNVQDCVMACLGRLVQRAKPISALPASK
jgi:hypothetical protein